MQAIKLIDIYISCPHKFYGDYMAFGTKRRIVGAYRASKRGNVRPPLGVRLRGKKNAQHWLRRLDSDLTRALAILKGDHSRLERGEISLPEHMTIRSALRQPMSEEGREGSMILAVLGFGIGMAPGAALWQNLGEAGTGTALGALAGAAIGGGAPKVASMAMNLHALTTNGRSEFKALRRILKSRLHVARRGKALTSLQEVENMRLLTEVEGHINRLRAEVRKQLQ